MHPLFYATVNGSKEVVQLFLDTRTVDIELADSQGYCGRVCL